jgi:hypothetical protein
VTDVEVDMVLLGGDLFHDNKPSRKAMYQVMRSIRLNCLGEKPCELQVLGDQSIIFDDKYYPTPPQISSPKSFSNWENDIPRKLRRPRHQHRNPRLLHPRKPRRPHRRRLPLCPRHPPSLWPAKLHRSDPRQRRYHRQPPPPAKGEYSPRVVWSE